MKAYQLPHRQAMCQYVATKRSKSKEDSVLHKVTIDELSVDPKE